MLHESENFLCGCLPCAQGNPRTTPEDVAEPAVVGITEHEFLPLNFFLLVEDGIEDL